MKQQAIYIVASHRNGTLYLGVTSNLVKRIYDHKQGIFDGFTKKYNCSLLVFYELHQDMESAILKEKKLKGASRKKKLFLIENMNPNWKDLYEYII